MLSVPPLPEVVDQTVVQELPSVETSMRYERPYAASQRRTVRPTVFAPPRSTVICRLSA